MTSEIKRNHPEQLAQLIEMTNGTLQCWTPGVVYVFGADGFTYAINGPAAPNWRRANEKMLKAGLEACRLPQTDAYQAGR